jgi:hypothetical protein
MKLLATGNYSVKFRAFKITFGTLKGRINENIDLPVEKVKFKKPIDLPGPLDLVVELDGSHARVMAVFNGFPVYSEEIDLTTLLKVKETKLKGFDVRGVKVSDLILKIV